MEIKKDYVLNSNTLGDVFKLSCVEPYKKYDETTQKTTDEIEGMRFYVTITIPEKEIYDEKLAVKIAGRNPIPQYKSGDTAFCRFTNLQLIITKYEFGKFTIRGEATGIELLSTSDNEQIKGQLKLNLNNSKQ